MRTQSTFLHIMCKGLISTTALILLHAQPEMKNEIKTAGNGCPEKITITIKKNLNIKYKYRSNRTLLIILKDRNAMLLKSFKYYSRSNFNPTHRRKCPEIRKRSPHKSVFLIAYRHGQQTHPCGSYLKKKNLNTNA